MPSSGNVGICRSGGRCWGETLKAGEGLRVLFFDETAVFRNMMRPCGWTPVSERCPGSLPFNHQNTTTLIAALSPEGIVAPMILYGPLDSTSFGAWVKLAFVPELRDCDVVVCDNVPMHKIVGIRKVIKDAGAKLILPPP